MSNDLKRLIKALEAMEEVEMLDAEIAVYTSGEYKDIQNLSDLVDSLEDELSYAAEASE